MDIQSKIESDIIVALKGHDEQSLSVLRMLKNALKNVEIEKRDKLTETEIISVLDKQAKQRKDSAEQFRIGGRADLAQKEEAELVLIESFLPQKMTREELSELVGNVISEMSPSGPSEIGSVMKEVIKRAEGRGDGKLISEIVREKLK